MKIEKKRRSFFESANYAIMGIIASFKNERNFRVHFLISILVLLAALKLGIPRLNIVLLLLAITYVLMAEMMNTSLELLTNAFVKEEDPHAKLAKDVAAGAVLISVVGAIFIGYFVFFNKFRVLVPRLFEQIKGDPVHVAVISLVLVILLTIFLKTFSTHGTPLKGGMPSGHSALAFATATLTISFTKSWLLISACFLLAFMVAQSRVQTRIHGWWEVFSGALLGFSVTLLLLSLFLR